MKMKMKIKTVCAWCGALMSETDCPETQNSQALVKDGVMISHGLCPSCRRVIEEQYGLNKNGGDKNV